MHLKVVKTWSKLNIIFWATLQQLSCRNCGTACDVTIHLI